MPAASLRDCDVDRRLGAMNGTLRNQVERTAFRRVVAEVDFKVVVAGDSLVLAASETVDSLSVELRERGR